MVEREVDYRRVVLLAARLMCATFVAIVVGWLAVERVHAWVSDPAGLHSGDAGNGHEIEPGGPSKADSEFVAVVRLVSASETGSIVGSGFVVGNCVVTNHHVVADSRSLSLSYAEFRRSDTKQQSGQDSWSSVLTSWPGSDIALVASSRASVGTGPILASSPVDIGQSVTLNGYQGGERLVRLNGTVHALVGGDAYGIDGPVILIDRIAGEGMSGGPVINGEGEVVAMLSRIDELTGLTIAIPMPSLRSHIDSYSDELTGQGC